MATANFENFKVTANYKGDKKAEWGDKMPENWNNHRSVARLSFGRVLQSLSLKLTMMY